MLIFRFASVDRECWRFDLWLMDRASALRDLVSRHRKVEASFCLGCCNCLLVATNKVVSSALQIREHAVAQGIQRCVSECLKGGGSWCRPLQKAHLSLSGYAGGRVECRKAARCNRHHSLVIVRLVWGEFCV